MEVKFWHKKRNEYEDYFTHDLYVDERGDVYCDVGYGINGLNLYRTVNGGETWEFIKFLPDIHFIVDNSQLFLFKNFIFF